MTAKAPAFLESDSAIDVLRKALGLASAETPFPWQAELLKRFEAGDIPRSLDIPTGLGKTGVMAIWLVARALGAKVPRRLAYVVDRRAVVDQATEVAMQLRDFVEHEPAIGTALGLGTRTVVGRVTHSLPISTLRGKFVDNKEWLEDPASPAIVVGTVDMVGSRLLFEGYGTTRKMRPYHAGLLGADTLVVLDEAHLVPPFEKLLESVAESVEVFGPHELALRKLVPPFSLLSLSATGRVNNAKPFGLNDDDLKHPVIQRRLNARKRLSVHTLDDQTELSDALAEHAWRLADGGRQAVRCIVFCNERRVAAATKDALEKRARGDKKAGIGAVEVDTELFVGGRRVFERVTAGQWLKERGFIAGIKVARIRAAFVFATSAGEVGVDLDADHMVSDLVAWERMVQRLGRVNRRGDGHSDIIVVVEPEKKPKKAVEKALAQAAGARDEKEERAVAEHEAALERARALRKPVDLLPHKDGAADASTGAIRGLRARARENGELQQILDAATTPAPLRPALTRALVDAWSMTSLEEHTGRPEIDPWLRGWVEDLPQSSVVWRKHLPVRKGGEVAKNEIKAFFEAAPPHASEVLEAESFRVVDWLATRADALCKASTRPGSIAIEDREDASEGQLLRTDDVAGFVLTGAGDLRRKLTLGELSTGDDNDTDKRKREKLAQDLAGATLVVDARIGGLSIDGLLGDDEKLPARTIDDHSGPWMDGEEPFSGSSSPVVRFRVLAVDAGQSLPANKLWRERFRFAADVSEDGAPKSSLVVVKWRHDAATEEDRSAGRPQLLDAHQSWTEDRARELGRRLGLPAEYVEMLAFAAGLHDEGKQAKAWQRAFNAKADGIYAKTRGPLNVALLNGYRHEFGSLPFAMKSPRFGDLSADLQDLALHLIAAHHGFARPVIGTKGCAEPPSVLENRAREVALRFARLQKRWGPWGLAWWETLLRAADVQASRDNDAADLSEPKESP